MKRQKIVIVFFIFLLAGIATLAQVLVKQDTKRRIREIRQKGNYLVSLIATHSLQHLENGRRDYFLKSLAALTNPDGIAYCFVHDNTSRPVVSLVPAHLLNKIPEAIKANSLFSMGLIEQKYQIDDSIGTFYELAKPIYEKGSQTGTVRVGLHFTPTTIFSMERISLLAMIVFLVFAAVIFAYYGVTLALRSLAISKPELKRITDAAIVPHKTKLAGAGGIAQVIEDLGLTLAQLKSQLKKIEADNLELNTRVGVAVFRKKQFLNILDSLNFGIIMTDIQDRLIFANSYILNLFGLKLNEVLDRSLENVIPNDDLLSLTANQETGNSTAITKTTETHFAELSPSESYRIAISYLQDEGGGAIGKLMTITNVTNEKLGEEAQQEFIAHISHELMTPLTTIKSYNEMLMDDEIDSSEMKIEFYNTINEETNRLTCLIQNLLNISKIEMGGLTIGKELVRTDWLFEDSIAAFEGLAQKNKISLEKIAPANYPTLVGDKELLKVAINNILSNAIKYTPEHGTITFSLRDEHERVIFEIIDSGYGISKEDLPFIFNKSYRSADPKIREQNGSGFGLALASEIIKLHGGEIEVQSEPGSGTQFVLSIPKEEYHLGNQ
jgi:two-component system sensor histidine kinase VicK